MTPGSKGWAWSYSKLKNFETCPKKHFEVDLAKNYTDSTEQLDWGNEVHKKMADACSGKAPLPETMKPYQKWVDMFAWKGAPGQLLVEQKYALTRDFQPTAYFGPSVWYRGVGDLVRICGPVAIGVDWKTGKILHDSPQLMLLAQCIFANHPQVQKVHTEFVWLKDECTTKEDFTRAGIANEWIGMLPRIGALQNAADTMTYPPKPSRLCAKHCPVQSCPFHGKYH